jgi:hypothetical protein
MPYIGNPSAQRFTSPRAASVFSGDGSTTAFTLEEAVATDEDILVSVDGVIQEPSVAYAVSSGTTLTFTAAPSSNSGNNIFVYYIARTLGSVSMPDGQNVNAANFSASGTGAITGNTTVGGTLGVTGAVTANAGVVVDNITIDGTEIDLSSGDLTIDVAGSIILDAGGDGQIEFADTGTTFGILYDTSNDFGIYSTVQDKDIKFQGNDGGSVITALTLDMSDAGAAIFNGKIHGASGTSLQLQSASGGAFIVSTNGANERLRITSAGNLQVATTISPANLVDTTNGEGLGYQAGDFLGITRDGGGVMHLNRLSSDGEIVTFRHDASAEGNISISGGTVSYNAFSGSHWSRLTDNSKPTILKGTVIETIDEMCDWYQAQITVPKTDDTDEYIIKKSIALPDGKKVGDTISYTHEKVTYDNAVIVKENDNKHTKCKISDTEDSKRVYGVFAAWDNDDDTINDMYVTAVGTHVVRINKDITVAAGDLLVSNGDGTAKKLSGDTSMTADVYSSIIGKVLTNIKQETYDDDSYTVPCALYCG